MRNSLRDSVSIQLVSDLHLETPFSQPEYDTFVLPVKAPHLALLGDVGNTKDRRLFEFLEKQLRRYETVFFLLGNHEPYGSSFDESLERVLRFESENGMTRALHPEVGKFVLLDRVRYDVPGTKVTLLGCTLFSYVPPHQQESVSLAVNDFTSKFAKGKVRDWTVDTHNAAHSLDLNWLNAQVAEIGLTAPDREIAVLTHHSPTKLPAANRSDYLQDPRQILSAFATDISRNQCWRSPQVRLWAFGHTHFNCDFIEDQTDKAMRVLTNQKGYAQNEAPGFDAGLTVKLGDGSGFVHVTTVREGQRFSYPGSIPKRSTSLGGSKRSSQVQSPTSDFARASTSASSHKQMVSYSSSKRSSQPQVNLMSDASRSDSNREKSELDRSAYNQAVRSHKAGPRKKSGGCGCCSVM